MKKFKFRLESLLLKRQMLEEQAQQQLAIEQEKLKVHQNELTRIFEEYKSLNRKTRDGCITLAELEMDHSYKAHLLDRIEIARTAAKEQQKVVDEKKKQLLTLHRDLKAVETLREKDLEAHQSEAKREETRQMDEFSVLRFNHGDKKKVK